MTNWKHRHPWSFLMRAIALVALAVIPFAPVIAEEAVATASDEFTIALLPDTQYYSESFPKTYVVQTEWIKRRAKPDNIRFVIHLGDIVNNADVEEEWKRADRAHKILDGVVPYSILPGNHDMDKQGDRLTYGTSFYDKYFPPSRFEGAVWYGGHEGENNANNYCLFDVAGMKFLVLSLEFVPRDTTLQWAAAVLDAHRDRRVIVATHYYMKPKGRPNDPHPYRMDGAGPEDLWNRFIRKQPNIFMVVSGHVLGTGHQVSTNDAGHPVLEILCDYQGLPNGGDGWLQVLRFVPRENKIQVEACSPLLDKKNDDAQQTYTLEYDMSRREQPKAASSCTP